MSPFVVLYLVVGAYCAFMAGRIYEARKHMRGWR